MGLLTVLKKQRMREREMRILMLGLDNAGKTTIVKRLAGEDISAVSPTFGFNIKTLVYEKYTLNIWDVGGQTRLRSYWRNYFEQTDALIWVVDAADRMRLEDCRDELHKLLVEERLAGASLLVFANKQDLAGALSDEQIAEVLQLAAIQSHRWHIQGCSAVSSAGVDDGFSWVVKDVAARLYTFV